MPHRPAFLAGLACICWLGGLALAQAAASPSCSTSAMSPRRVVELYTSEGCNSCPPADQWLAALPRDGSVLALAFHVDYWDDLGWRDHFADPAYTARQRALQSTSGARFIYTPQFVVDGRDFPGWRYLAPASIGSGALPTAPASLRLRRDGMQLVAEVGAASGGARLAGYWALLEDGHQSQVGAGENAGHLLRHEHVVRRYAPVGPWAADSPRQWTWPVPMAAAGHAAQAVFVLTDASGARPLAAQQLSLAPGC
jgi:hypothetical protein